jgi:protein-S-isoprenylcysteine O-methyltransferase Ste14
MTRNKILLLPLSSGRGWWFDLRGAIGFLCLFPGILIAVFSSPAGPKGSWLDTVCETFGWSAFLSGVMIRLWATLYLGGRKEEELVTDGPYSICRNPVYVGSLLIALSIGLMLQSLTFSAGLALAVIAYAKGTVPAEEKLLREKFKEEFVKYCQQVPRFWPRLSNFHTADVIEVRVKGLRLEFARLAVLIWLPALLEILALFRIQPWWPHLFTLW